MKGNFSMRPSINLVVSEPYITLDEFCRRTGYKPSYARQMIRENRLPIRKKAGVNSLIEINMFAFTMEAAQGYEIAMQA
ncbi:regulator [Serratia symbiotica]|uniref:regulator n=1 Tax=Serratia symbiotica TaxID=138074 RepID=UPI001CEFDB54|nr:regulator [Serratia symbiotica]